MPTRVAVDIGGTFTDLVAVDEASGAIHVHKASSSRTDPISAVSAVLAKAGLPLEDISLFVHGTTVATNALIERDGTRIAFVTNRGFRDVIFIQEATRRDLYSLAWDKPRPLVARYDCLEVGGRIDSRRQRRRSRSTTTIDAIVAHLRREGIRSVAICLLFAHLNPVHELELAQRLREALPDLSISLSHRVYPALARERPLADRRRRRLPEGHVRPLHRATSRAGRQVPAHLLLMKTQRRRRRGARRGRAARQLPRLAARSAACSAATYFASPRRLREHHDHRHRRHVLATSAWSPAARSRAPRRFEMDYGMPAEGADDGHQHDRRRRRLDRLDRRRRPAARRPAERRRDPRPGVLRPRRHRARRSPTPTSCSAA